MEGEGKRTQVSLTFLDNAAHTKQTRLFLEILPSRSENLTFLGTVLLCRQQSMTAKSQYTRQGIEQPEGLAQF